MALGVASTLGHLSSGPDAITFSDLVTMSLLMSAGAAVGVGVARKVEPTSLPQTVAAFHR